MLDKETKNKIDDLRQILVGKVTDPRSQVEQITNALLYKFMNDMDEESISLGGVPSYFVKEYKKYSWKNLLDEKISGIERVNLYSTAIDRMYFNENLPKTFREIFKDSALPFKDPKVFNKFITRINDFKYSNSESLGDSFEYLLSFMGSQGDAGQFRTPRHIIDFVVEIINPKKNETILDPACGTAGFLISSYKYILKQNTNKVLGDNLNPLDRKKIANNLNGYDISPEFLKVSLMNMFLHKFNNPKISEYDTLSSEDNWNEYFDVILANPPFFSPKGGITPHNRFRVKSKRAEVLFIDYIEEHLKPNGRAGIIVPEGILFKPDKSYEELRKILVKGSLVGIISLPAGVFEPYSGNKTNILFLDKKVAKIKKDIFFVKIENDGFSLNKNRRVIDSNDLPELKKKLRDLNNIKSSKKIQFIKKDIILNNARTLLNFSEYSKKDEQNQTEQNYVPITSIFETISPKKKIKSYEFKKTGKFPIIDQSKKFISGFWDNEIDCVDCNLPVIIFGDHTRIVKYVDFKFVAGADGTKIIKPKNNLIESKFLFYILKSLPIENLGYSRHFKELKKFSIPLPSLEKQNQISIELDSYQKIIDSCKDIIEHYKPSFKVNPSWERVKLGNLVDIVRGGSPRPINKYITDDEKGINWIKIGDATLSSKYIFKTKEKIIKDGIKHSRLVKKGDFILSNSMSVGKPYIMKTEGCIHDGWLLLKRKKENILEDYLYYVLSSQDIYNQFKFLSRGGVVNNLNKEIVSKVEVPLPEIEVQKSIISILEEERNLIINNEKLIKNYEQKIKDTIDVVKSN